MSKITVTSRQNLLDIAIQHGGSLEAVFEMAMTNNRSITDDLNTGEELEAPAMMDQKTVQHFAVNNLQPATAITTAEIAQQTAGGEGIEFWGIEIDFIVS